MPSSSNIANINRKVDLGAGWGDWFRDTIGKCGNDVRLYALDINPHILPQHDLTQACQPIFADLFDDPLPPKAKRYGMDLVHSQYITAQILIP